jgi:hypothetical protein
VTSGRTTAATKKAMLSSKHLHKVAAAGGDFMQLQGTLNPEIVVKISVPIRNATSLEGGREKTV